MLGYRLAVGFSQTSWFQFFFILAATYAVGLFYWVLKLWGCEQTNTGCQVLGGDSRKDTHVEQTSIQFEQDTGIWHGG